MPDQPEMSGEPEIAGRRETLRTPEMLASYYVYYRIAAGEEQVARESALRLLDRVAESTGVRGRLMVKRGEPNLWMEVYEGVTDDAKFEWELADAVGRLGIQGFLQAGSGRHVECFEEVNRES